MRLKVLSCGLVGHACMAAWPLAVLAQQPAPTDSAPTVSELTANEIIVTARRRDETLQTTPVAVTALQPSMLEAKATMNIGDLQGAAPNVLITQQPTGASTANIAIRGIAFADVEKSFDPAVGVNVDGVYIGTSTGQFLDFFDIESIEILRGPQGTLFGRNTIAGVINIRRTRPTGEWGAKLEASYGSYDTIGLRGVLNIPLVEDVLAVKLFEFHQQTDGYMRDAFTRERLGRNNSENFGATFLLTPTDNFEAILTLEEQDQRFDSYFGSLMQTGDVFCSFVPAEACNRNKTDDIYEVFRAIDSRGKYRAKAATLEMSLDTDPLRFDSVSSYRESKERQIFDLGEPGLYIADRDQKYHQFSQEFRASGQLTDTFDFVSGLYYFVSKYRLYQETTVFGAFAGAQDTRGKSESYAAFLDMNWEFAPQLRLSGGGRFTHDKKAYRNPFLYSGAAKESWSKFTPKVTLDYRPNDDMMVYGTWSRGYRSGGFNGRGLTVYSASTPYDPETVDSYELGLKSTFLDRAVSLNIAGFYTDYKDIQQSSTITLAGGQGNETIVTNAAGAKIKGIEADLTVQPIDDLTFRASVGYTDASFRGFLVEQPVTLADASIITRVFDFSKVNPIFAPKWTLSLNGEYVVRLEGETTLTFTAGYRYLSPYDQQIAPDPSLYPGLLADPNGTSVVPVPRNDPRVRSDPQNLLDLSVSLAFPVGNGKSRGRLTGFVRNVLDDRGPSFAFTVATFPPLWAYATPREPRVFGVQLGFEY
ncbi:TonB-dependent receptor [Pedomonas sp. V897]|uniref:TonB-dependent receptor n=1 Tax=Pedomonas sp. V897 TaxID=3446482 RepID=UPI003EE018D3